MAPFSLSRPPGPSPAPGIHFINVPAWESGGVATPPAAEATPPLQPRAPQARPGPAPSMTPSPRAGAPWRRRAAMAAGSVWKGLVGLGLFALAHAAFSAAQRESPAGGHAGAPPPLRGRWAAPGAGPGRHHHRPEARARRRGRPCPWGPRCGGSRGSGGSAATGKGRESKGGKGGAAARRVAASARLVPCPGPAELPAARGSASRARSLPGAPQLPGQGRG